MIMEATNSDQIAGDDCKCSSDLDHWSFYRVQCIAGGRWVAAAMLIAGALLTAGEDPRRLAGPSYSGWVGPDRGAGRSQAGWGRIGVQDSGAGKLKRVQGPDRY
jgi:hypothetical protein